MSSNSITKYIPNDILISILATCFALGVGLGLIALTGVSVSEAIAAFWAGMVGSPYAIGRSINRAVALMLVGIGFVLAFRANLTNVGGEGQINLGGLASTAVALNGAHHLSFGLSVLIPLLAGFTGGAIWGWIAGFIKVRRGTNEVISTLLLSFIAIQLVSWSVQETYLLRQPRTSAATLPTSLDLPENTQLPLLFANSPMHIGILVALVAVILVGTLLAKTAFGLRLKAVGLNKKASRRAGLPTNYLLIWALAFSGGLGGLAGAILVQGELALLREGFSSGYGFDGLVVGLLSRGSPLGVILGALFFGFLRSGGINMEISAKVPSAIVLIIQGLVVVSVAGAYYFTEEYNHE
ncbi:ABC transporter permease [Phormidium tenue FACHB-886]|nr:ABC transporter permease [Phormidium tenue FACHB-886]